MTYGIFIKSESLGIRIWFVIGLSVPELKLKMGGCNVLDCLLQVQLEEVEIK